MASFEYLLYLSAVMVFIIVLIEKYKIRLTEVHLYSILLVGSLYLVWDIFATWRGHWEFNNNYIIGLYIMNQPVEEVLFFVFVPLLYAILWLIANKKTEEV